MKTFTMIATTNAKPGRDAEFLKWYETVHLGEVLGIPGIVTAQLLTVVDIPEAGEPRYRYLGIYEIESDDSSAVFNEMMRRYVSGEMTNCDAMHEISYNGIFDSHRPVIRKS